MPLEIILHALADPVRVAIFADIVRQDCSQNCSSFLTVGQKAILKSTLSHHFRILREAGLIYSERRGVEMHNTSRCAEVDARYPGCYPPLRTRTIFRWPSERSSGRRRRNPLCR